MHGNDSMAPPDVAMPASAPPDLSGLGSPAAAKYAGKLDGQTGMAIPPDVPGNHSKLAGMLMGLGVALSASGKAISTHGKEGGAQDVANFMEQQQREKMATDQA